MSFKSFVLKFNVTIGAISILKGQKILLSLYLIDVRIYLKDGPFKYDIGIKKLHSARGTH